MGGLLAAHWQFFSAMFFLLVLSCFLISEPSFDPFPKEFSKVCARIIDDKQGFIDASKNGVRCKASPQAKNEWKGRGDRPNTEYDVQEFLFQSKSPDPNRRDVTVAVQLSIDRLSNLKRLGNTWQGPVSASVYIPHPRHSAKGHSAVAELSCFHELTKKEGIFSLDIGVVFGLDGIEEMNATVSDTNVSHSVPLEKQYRFMYPVNVGRNVALAQVRTDLTLLLDVDFIFSKQAREAALGNNAHWENVFCEMRRRVPQGRGMFAVIPAFESVKDRSPPSNKNSLISSYKQGYVRRMTGNMNMHCPTDFEYWMRSNHDYVVQYRPRFEPYGIAATELIPWFPEDFKGYHFNKIIVYFSMAAKGWDFVVLPDHFVVHVWHPPSKSKQKVLGSEVMMEHVAKHKQKYIRDLANRADTCAPRIVARALKVDHRVLEGDDIKPEPVGATDDVYKFLEVSCAKISKLGEKSMVFPD